MLNIIAIVVLILFLTGGSFMLASNSGYCSLLQSFPVMWTLVDIWLLTSRGVFIIKQFIGEHLSWTMVHSSIWAPGNAPFIDSLVHLKLDIKNFCPLSPKMPGEVKLLFQSLLVWTKRNFTTLTLYNSVCPGSKNPLKTSESTPLFAQDNWLLLDHVSTSKQIWRSPKPYKISNLIVTKTRR